MRVKGERLLLVFQSTPPCEGRLFPNRNATVQFQFQSTPSCGGDLVIRKYIEGTDYISIHAPRVGGDQGVDRALGIEIISIHAPRVGGDQTGCISRQI